MSITFDARKLTDVLVKLEAVCDQAPQMAQKVSEEALGHLAVGAARSIYSTQSGAYQRTQDLLRGLHSRPKASKNLAAVEVSGEAPYHRYVEFGTGATELSPDQAQAYALANPNPINPLYLGRSGVNYSLPGPIVGPAQAFSLFRLKQLFTEAVKAAL